MKAAVIGILGCAMLLLAIAAFAPASLLDRRIAAATGGKVRLVDATGTVWNGRGALANAAGTWRAPIAWTVAWAALATGTLAGAAAARSTRTGAMRDSSPRAPSRTSATSMPHSFRRTAACAAA